MGNTNTLYGHKVMNERVFRVFASKDSSDKALMKVKNDKPEKIGYTPNKCFINNKNIAQKKTPPHLDKEWYIAIARSVLMTSKVNIQNNLNLRCKEVL